jgi:L-amino acid N-acyltransferase YncA
LSVTIRPASAGDAGTIAEIHNQGVSDRTATFRTDPRTADDVLADLDSGQPVLVAERDRAIVGWAGAAPYDEVHPWYAGVGEATIWVDRSARRTGAGRALLAALDEAAAKHGFFKLTARIFASNQASVRLFENAGYRTVGTHLRHGRLDGRWKDVVVLEKPLGDAAD